MRRWTAISPCKSSSIVMACAWPSSAPSSTCWPLWQRPAPRAKQLDPIMTRQQQAQAEPAQDRRALAEAGIASTVGTTIEWYDFFLYRAAAALVFPKLFFPQLDPFAGQLASFGTFTVGFIARPVGSVIFGHLGDRIGRKSTLVATLLLMGVSTFIV